MSWDIWVEMDAGKKALESESINHTHNCNEMIRVALNAVNGFQRLGIETLYDLDQKSCVDVGPVLRDALTWWVEQPAALFKQLEPSNGWGSAASAYMFWSSVADLCFDYPLALLRVNG